MIIYAVQYNTNLHQPHKNTEKNRDYCFNSFNWDLMKVTYKDC